MILLRELEKGDAFRTLLTDRVGRLVEKGQYGLRVEWRDGVGKTEGVHLGLVVQPWARWRRRVKALDALGIGT